MKALQKLFTRMLICGALLFLLSAVRVSAATVPQKVQGMKCGVVTKNSINISWSAQEGVSGYQIYRSMVYDGKYKKVLDVNPEMNAFCNKNLSGGQEYYYKVRAYTRTGSKVTYGKFSKKLRTRTKMPAARKAVVRTRGNIRKHAGTSHPIVATVNANTVVSIICAAKDKDGDDWSYVSCKVDGRTVKGYVYNSLLQGGGSQQQMVTQTGQVTASNLNVRSSAGLRGRVIASLKRGQKVTILGQERASDGTVWYLIQFKKNGRTIKGYVSSRYIKLV